MLRYVIIDEFHHSAAKSYRKLLEYIKPKILSFEEYSKEKEEIKKEIPGIVEKLSKFFKDIKSKIFD